LKTPGEIICTVPFMEGVHAAPNDYLRYTRSGLEKIFHNFQTEIIPIGSGLDITIGTIINYKTGSRIAGVGALLGASLIKKIFPYKDEEDYVVAYLVRGKK
jgi:hypothetical protein